MQRDEVGNQRIRLAADLALTSIYRRLTPGDPERAWQSISRVKPAHLSQRAAYTGFAAVLEAEQIPRFAQRLREQLGDMGQGPGEATARGQAAIGFAEGWAETDLAAAGVWLGDYTAENENGRRWVDALYGQWAMRHPEEMVNRLQAGEFADRTGEIARRIIIQTPEFGPEVVAFLEDEKQLEIAVGSANTALTEQRIVLPPVPGYYNRIPDLERDGQLLREVAGASPFHTPEDRQRLIEKVEGRWRLAMKQREAKQSVNK